MNMEAWKLKEEMKSLWRESFRDSSAYLGMAVDAYFDPETVAYKEENGELKTALLGIPYEFAGSGGSQPLKGLYLCGLATRKDSRRKGYMSGLLEDINRKAEVAGYDFTFLIPPSEGVRAFCRSRGYHDSFFKIRENYVKGHKFKSDTSIQVSLLSEENISEILEFLCVSKTIFPKGKGKYFLQHTRRDWEMVLKKQQFAVRMIYVGRKDNAVVGVAFAREGDRGRIEVARIVGEDDIIQPMLAEIERLNPEKNITFVRDLVEAVGDYDGQIWSPFFARNNPKTAEYEDVAEVEVPFNIARNAYPSGMAKIFDIDKILKKIGWEDLKALEGYNADEQQELLLRRPAGAGADALEKILQLPELTLSMSLMP